MRQATQLSPLTALMAIFQAQLTVALQALFDPYRTRSLSTIRLKYEPWDSFIINVHLFRQ